MLLEQNFDCLFPFLQDTHLREYIVIRLSEMHLVDDRQTNVIPF